MPALVSPSEAEVHELSRRLRARAEAILAVVFLAPEAGDPPFGLSPAEWYVGTRAAPLGRVSGEVVGAVFGAIDPESVVRSTAAVFSVADPQALLDSRLALALDVLERVLGPAPEGADRAFELLSRAAVAGRLEGHPLYGALRSLPWPDRILGRLWRAADLVREHRGDSHVNAWRSAGLRGAEINGLTEMWKGRPLGSEASVVNGWSASAVAGAVDSLNAAGLAQAETITEEGRRLRDEIERATSRQEREIVEALGDDAGELFALLEPWARQLGESLQPPYWWHLQARNASPAGPE